MAHVQHLVECGRFDDAGRKLSRLVAYLEQRLAASPRDVRSRQRYAEELSHVQEGMALHKSREARRHREAFGKDNQAFGVGAVAHTILSLLHHRVSLQYNQQMMPDIYGDLRADLLERTNFNRLKRVLIDIKRNKKGRPEQLCSLVRQHLATIPGTDAGAVQRDMESVLAMWT